MRVCVHVTKFMCGYVRVRVRLCDVYVCVYHMLRVCMCKRA